MLITSSIITSKTFCAQIHTKAIPPVHDDVASAAGAQPCRRRRHQRHQAPIHSSAWAAKIAGQIKSKISTRSLLCLFFQCRWTFKDLHWMFKSFSRKISQLTNIVVKWVDTTSASKSHVVEPRVKYATRLQICPLHIFGNPKTTPKNRKSCIFLPWKGLQFFQGPKL